METGIFQGKVRHQQLSDLVFPGALYWPWHYQLTSVQLPSPSQKSTEMTGVKLYQSSVLQKHHTLLWQVTLQQQHAAEMQNALQPQPTTLLPQKPSSVFQQDIIHANAI